MKKKLLLLFLLTIGVLADTVSFREGKYVEAISLFTYRDGNVTYDENRTVVQYKDGKTILKEGNSVTVHDGDKLLTTINLLERADVALYFSLTKALFLKDFKQLEEHFKIEKKDKQNYVFKPLDEVGEVMNTISLSLKKDESIQEFILDFRNGDKIKIEAK